MSGSGIQWENPEVLVRISSPESKGRASMPGPPLISRIFTAG
jgi:hypothetical protein